MERESEHNRMNSSVNEESDSQLSFRRVNIDAVSDSRSNPDVSTRQRADSGQAQNPNQLPEGAESLPQKPNLHKRHSTDLSVPEFRDQAQRICAERDENSPQRRGLKTERVSQA